ncbi:MAG: hypothetical protein ABGY11_10115 [Candidatus Thioglobus sp.]|jgi:hypothetical protein
MEDLTEYGWIDNKADKARRNMKDYNVMSIHGISDKEYIEEFNLDPELEGTPEINDAMMDVVGSMNLKAEKERLMEEGTPSDQAQKEAFRITNNKRKQAETHLKAVTEQRGY